MAVFSTDQNRQLYVVNNYVSSVADIQNLGDATVVTDTDNVFHLVQKGYGELVKSDAIDPAKILYASITAPEKMTKKLKKATITINKDVTNNTSGTVAPTDRVIVGDYILRINFRQLYGMSDDDIYLKYACVAGTSSMTVKEFYLTLAQSVIKNFKRCITPLIGVSLDGGTTLAKDIKKKGADWYVNGSKYTSNPTGVTLLELPLTSEYVRGTAKLETVNFEVIPTTITKVNDNVKEEVVWGTVTKGIQSTKIPNTYDIADLEYFCMGERGDLYRGAMWPNNINTLYMVDLTDSLGYYVIDITYTYSGDCEDVQQSKKTVTIVTNSLDAMESLAQALYEVQFSLNGVELGE